MRICRQEIVGAGNVTAPLECSGVARSDGLRELVAMLLQSDPALRPTTADVLKRLEAISPRVCF